MSELDRRTMLGAAGIGAIAALAHARAGPINPPTGPVSPTGRTLQEILNHVPPPQVGPFRGRISIDGGAGRTISQPGSYVLTGDIAVNGAPAITIRASNVTLDLNGFAVRRTAPGGGAAVYIDSASRNVTVRNGRIAGFETGVFADNSTASLLLEDLLVTGAAIVGMSLQGEYYLVRRCTLLEVGGGTANPYGISIDGDGSHVDRCTVSRFVGTPAGGHTAIRMVGNGGTISRCGVTADAPTTGSGLLMSGQIAYRDNTVVNMNSPYNASNGAGDGGGNV
ncbi:MAG: hypothetical protein ACREJO_16610 [Phycisphaerales bacterium]